MSHRLVCAAPSGVCLIEQVMIPTLNAPLTRGPRITDSPRHDPSHDRSIRSNTFHRFARPNRSQRLCCVEAMTPECALSEQIERYRRMTGEQRLALALELHELSCNVAREGIRQQHPEADEAEVERHLRRRLELVQ